MAKRKEDDFIRAPRSIVFAQDLSSTEVRILLLLIDKYNTMKAFGRLDKDGSFYMTGKEFESKMDIKKDQVMKKYIPQLERMGFFHKVSRPQTKEGQEKTYCYFIMDWDEIYNHQGNEKNAKVQEMRAGKAVKMREAAGKKTEVASGSSINAEPQRMTFQQTSSQQAVRQSFNNNDIMLDDYEDASEVQAKLLKESGLKDNYWNNYL